MNKILVVDDDRALRLLLEEMLSPRYECSLVCNGREAYHLAMQHQLYDVVLMDIQMPDWNGVDALAMIQAFSPEARVVMMSGYVDKALEKELLGFECVRHVLYKPLSCDLLHAVLQEAIEEGDFALPNATGNRGSA